MKTDVFHEALLDAIKERIPSGSNIASVLMDILFIGKEAVYRRLRGEVPFTLVEASIIAKELGISLDSIIGSETRKSRPFQMKLVEYNKPLEIDYAMLQNYVDIINNGRDDPYSEMTIAANTFPQTLYLNFNYLARFYLFKWTYHHEKGVIRNYEEIHVPDRLKKIQKASVLEHMYIKTTCYIFDNLVSLYLVNDIKYFAGIRLISEEDVQNIKNDFHKMLDYMEDIATSAKFATGENVYMYVSNINFENTYTYLQINNIKLSLIDAFVLNAAASLDNENFEKVKTWVLSLRRLSTLISQSGELQRMKFFKEQREIVDTI